MYEDKRYRKSGLGAIYSRMLRRASELGFNEIVLETVHSMTTDPLIYKKYGFQKAEVSQAVSPRCDIVITKKKKK